MNEELDEFIDYLNTHKNVKLIKGSVYVPLSFLKEEYEQYVLKKHSKDRLIELLKEHLGVMDEVVHMTSDAKAEQLVKLFESSKGIEILNQFVNDRLDMED